jgi:putative ABC transport system ATP-binding protein
MLWSLVRGRLKHEIPRLRPARAGDERTQMSTTLINRDVSGANAEAVDVVVLAEVTKVYGAGDNEVTALREISLALTDGSFTAMMGPSGSGKSTFLHVAAGLDRPTSGSVSLGGVELNQLDENGLSRLRRERVGFVFQSFNLVPSLSAADNITLPLRLGGRKADGQWLDEVVGRVGLGERLRHRPGELSGGQQQRVAIARALVPRPDVVFADEPTGALDLRTGKEILRLLREAVDALGQTVVMVTHDPVAASHADEVVFLADGSVVDRLRTPSADRVAERMTHLEG